MRQATFNHVISLHSDGRFPPLISSGLEMSGLCTRLQRSFTFLVLNNIFSTRTTYRYQTPPLLPGTQVPCTLEMITSNNKPASSCLFHGRPANSCCDCLNKGFALLQTLVKICTSRPQFCFVLFRESITSLAQYTM